MCLTFVYAGRCLPPEMVGYKVVSPEHCGVLFGTSFPLNVDVRCAKREMLTADSSQKYETGFHVYESLSDARDAQKAWAWAIHGATVIIKVRVREFTASGGEHMWVQNKLQGFGVVVGKLITNLGEVKT